MQTQDVLDFWFLPLGGEGYGQARAEWFRKDERFDAAIAQRFGAVLQGAVKGGLREWDRAGPRGTLARILVLDQFTRNAWRDTAAAFSGDALALAAAQELLASGADQALAPIERWFAYMPFEHAEDMAMQERSVALFTALAAHDPLLFDSALDYAQRHRDVIARFGRYPHRNGMLGRASTPDEVRYLAQPGSGF